MLLFNVLKFPLLVSQLRSFVFQILLLYDPEVIQLPICLEISRLGASLPGFVSFDFICRSSNTIRGTLTSFASYDISEIRVHSVLTHNVNTPTFPWIAR